MVLQGKRICVRVVAVLLMLCFTVGAMVPVAVAREPATPEISIKQAVLLALANSESVKKAEKEVEKKEEWKEYRHDELDYVPAAYAGTAAVEVPWAQALFADLDYMMSKRSLTAEEDKVVLDTCKKYWEVLKAQAKLKAADASLKSARKQLQNARVSYQVGMINESQMIGAEAQYEGAKAGLAAAQSDLDNAYTAFNRVVGLWPEDRPVLSDTVEYEPLEVDSLNHEVARVLADAPDVWQAEQMVALQGYLEDMMFYTGEYRPYQARKIEVEQAELDAASAKEMFEELTRSLYYGTKKVEESYAAALEKVKVAEETLRVKKIMFDVGMATAAEVADAEKSLSEAQSAAFELKCTHAYMKLAFEKPWAAEF